MSAAKEDCEELLTAAMPFAQRMLEQHGEFFPFAVWMTSDGEVQNISAYDGREQPPSTDVIAQLERSMAVAADRGEIKASALAFDVRITDPETGEKSDAIAVTLEHASGYAMTAYFLYRLEAERLEMGRSFSNKAAQAVFTGTN